MSTSSCSTVLAKWDRRAGVASLGEFRTLSDAASDRVLAFIVSIFVHHEDHAPRWLRARLPYWVRLPGAYARYFFLLFAYTARRWRELRAEGSESAVEVKHFLRIADVWAILAFGSALTLAAAVIQLVLAYQRRAGLPSVSIPVISASVPARARAMTELLSPSGSASAGDQDLSG